MCYVPRQLSENFAVHLSHLTCELFPAYAYLTRGHTPAPPQHQTVKTLSKRNTSIFTRLHASNGSLCKHELSVEWIILGRVPWVDLYLWSVGHTPMTHLLSDEPSVVHSWRRVCPIDPKFTHMHTPAYLRTGTNMYNCMRAHGRLQTRVDAALTPHTHTHFAKRPFVCVVVPLTAHPNITLCALIVGDIMIWSITVLQMLTYIRAGLQFPRGRSAGDITIDNV